MSVLSLAKIAFQEILSSPCCCAVSLSLSFAWYYKPHQCRTLQYHCRSSLLDLRIEQYSQRSRETLSVQLQKIRNVQELF